MIKIDKKIPITTKKRGRHKKYPFHEMKVGDSFSVITHDRTTIGNSARQWAKRENNGWKFTTSQTGNRLRIWRIK